MAIQVALHHRTVYEYDRRVTLSPQVIRLRPAPHARTQVLSYALSIEPREHFLNWQQDPFGNYLARAVFREQTQRFEVNVDLLAELHVVNPFDFFLEPEAEHWPFRYESALAKELAPYRETMGATGPLLNALLASLPRERMRTNDFLVALNRTVNSAVEYVIRMEPGVLEPEDTLAAGRGSCRDSAWLLVQCLRHLGFAARFTSGYLIQLVADEKPLDGPAGTSKDFTDLHAWAEVFLPGAGWIGLDATSGLLTGEGHIPLACTPEPMTAAPISGAVDECKVQFSHAMSVDRIHEDPRVTRPYTDAQWAAIDALGHAVDARLARGDVRATFGGEPTFVGIDAPDAPEWNTTSLGPAKSERAEDLLRRLHARAANGGLLHFGQGKWYPGEPLPRWAYGCYWRKDGEPVWEDATLFADSRVGYEFGDVEAQRFIASLAKRLDLDPGHAISAYEDAWYYLWRERRLPTNVDPLDARMDDEQERARLARIFERGLGAIAGYVLPLQPDPDARGPVTRWRSGPWFLRRERLYLLPGDSPIGFRLPLDSLPWAAAADLPDPLEVDPMAQLAPLPARVARQHILASRAAQPRRVYPPDAEHLRRPAHGVSARGVIRTALCVEARAGMLHVFLPPIPQLEDFLSLVQALEDTAATLRLPIRIEGYHPPADPRLEKLEVTPDPGVIEVNVAPVSTWSQLVDGTTALYEEARLARLRAEKFMLDGRHVGTGGGNHLTIGGTSAADSPFLRRPDLLRSLVGFWQDHPSLSYLFSGLFIGPTSQAPRIDEARSDALYELEVAFQRLPKDAREAIGTPPWLVDRALRNLLVDATGNTHRTEHCIDKLYSPDGPRGRLGLVELRAFEMPPHARMSCVQQLLVRALLALFWETPYDPKLVRYGTQLHDRYMLPHFVMQDFQDVLKRLDRAGFRLDPAWFEPFVEMRFPKIGEIVRKGIWLELRHALEPWHVLGEEQAAGGAVRYVDSSLERLQVKVRGAIGDRFVVTCNGHALPLHPTGTQGERVAGVRYRAWQPSSCLHPTIPVDAPLTIELVDTWLARSLGGCTYHVAHPGGLAYESLPVNANEAESRRVSRFSPLGHTPGRLVVAPPLPHPDFPFTLDLRRS
ncbi:MAG: transglutaminase family protein [Myxococcota bacterium]